MVEVEVSNLHFRIWSQPVDIDILTGKRCRLLECAKTLLDIAQESADWSPPLKCAVAGVFALIKDCEVPVKSNHRCVQLTQILVAIPRCQEED